MKFSRQYSLGHTLFISIVTKNGKYRKTLGKLSNQDSPSSAWLLYALKSLSGILLKRLVGQITVRLE